jgi:DNA-binding GntR family transcriptional regulator
MQDPRGTPVRLSDKAYNLIRHKIITLELPPMAPVDEQALVEDLQVGRTPIREALQRLSAEDLVFFAPRRGMFVADISITDLQKIFEVRLVLEGFCARLAAQRILPEQLCEMKAITGQLRLVPDSDRRALMHIDEAFHDLLYEAADNEFIAEPLRRLHAQSFRLWHMALDRMGTVRHAMEQHVEITAALEARDEDRAEALIRQHILEFQQELRTVL